MLSTILHTIATALAAHPAIAAWALASLAALYRSHTPAQWVAMGERIPRVQGLLRLARGAGLDPVRALEGAAQVVTGRVPVDPRDAEIASLREALAAYQRRTLDSHAVTVPFDPGARQTIPAEVAEVARRITDGQRGSASLRVLLAVVVGVAVVLPVGVILAGCPYVREGALRASTVVTDPRDCVPLATRCVAGVPVICSPSPVPGSVLHREWPLLPRDGTGAQRACSGGCVVDDAGAHCLLADAAVDGGAL